MIKFHPSERLLRGFAAGELSSGINLAVATHVEYCQCCSETVAAIEDELAFDLCKLDDEIQSPFDDMLTSILSASDETAVLAKDAFTTDKRESFVQIDGKKFKLPRTVQRKMERQEGQNWRNLAGIHSSALGDFDEYRASLIYIEPGVQVPMHKHKSIEMTVVLAGSLSDEQGVYKPGDFIVLDNNIEHSPKTQQSQCCLCLTVMDAPIQFTQGISRLLNPIAHLLF
ncbi:ChrR family anti-sigma-E factor [Catenovulum sediminis]|uniref:ChrR family anti-sigma-E factor n=1 Tax=Catenovulum sediminis TaxID=1740262 RepID=UPI00117D453B|nr:ChrR family anti-sigma-E factor [Catenovulum sediminis]